MARKEPVEKWFVERVCYETDAVKKRLGPYPCASYADKAEDGVNRNLDTVRFWTRSYCEQ